VKEIKKILLAELHIVPKEVFQECFQYWKKHWEGCIKVEENTSTVIKPISSKVSEKTIYLNCLEYLWTDLILVLLVHGNYAD